NVDDAAEALSTNTLPVTPSAAAGVVVPRPSLPVEESKRNPFTPAFPKRIVEEAERPLAKSKSVEVEFAGAPKELVGVKENVPLPEPQATPVFVSSPIVENVAQPAEPPAEDTMMFVVEARFAAKRFVACIPEEKVDVPVPVTASMPVVVAPPEIVRPPA